MRGFNSSRSAASDPLCESPARYNPRGTRRDFLAWSGAAALTAFLVGCGSGDGTSLAGVDLPPLSNSLVTLDPSTTSLGTVDGQTVTRQAIMENLFNIPLGNGQPADTYNAIFYGMKNNQLVPTRVVQSLSYLNSTVANPVRTSYNAQGLPTQAAAAATGESVTFEWGNDKSLTIRGFDAGGNLVGGCLITPVGADDYTVSSLPQNNLQSREAIIPAKTPYVIPRATRSYGNPLFGAIFGFFAVALLAIPWLGRFSNDLVSHLKSGALFGAGGLGALLIAGGAGTLLFSLVLVLLAVFLVYASFWPAYGTALSSLGNRFRTSSDNPQGIPSFGYLGGFD